MSDERPRLAVDPEWIAFAAGLKPALRLTYRPDEIETALARHEARGLCVRRASWRGDADDRTEILYVARTPADVAALADAEAPLFARKIPHDVRREAHRRMGERLGYPKCCVDRLLERLGRGGNLRRNGRPAHEDFVAAEHAAAFSDRFFGRLNNLLFDLRARLVSFYPCRYDCPAALAYADAVFAAVAREAPDVAEPLRAGLSVRLWLAPDGRRSVGSPLDGAELQLDFSRF